jgi:hypothetical protein
MATQYVLLFRAIMQKSDKKIECWKTDCKKEATMVFEFLGFQTATCSIHAENHFHTYIQTHRIFTESMGRIEE